MMKKFKQLILSALTLGCAASIAASVLVAGGAVIAPKAEEETSTKINTVDEFLLGAWIQYYSEDIKSYKEQTEELARCGMNLIDLPLCFSGSFTASSSSVTNDPDFWNYLQEYTQPINMYWLYYGSDPYNFQASYDDVKDLDNCVGYHLKDEPGSALLDSLSETVKEFVAGDPTRIPFVNMYPSYAGATNLGGTYRDYLTKWVNLVGSDYLEYLYFDHYPFTASESVRSTYFSDLETVRDVAFTNGRMKTGGFTQMGSWNGMTRPTVDMARWSTYSLLAYGMKSLSHFCWVAPAYVAPENGGEGMRDFVTDYQGNPTDLYDPMTILNWQVRQLGPVFMGMDVKHAYHTYNVPSGTEALPSGFLFQPAKETDDFVYSLAYSKDDSKKYVLVFNKALSGDAKDYTINVDTNTGVQGLTYYKPTDYTLETLPDPTDLSTLTAPEEVYIDVTNGSFTAEFKPGEMKIFKLEGDSVEIFENPEIPTANLKSGIYNGQQKLSLATGDVGAKIYYTTDGSYPSPTSSTTKLYDGLISLGEDGKFSAHTIRAIGVRGTDISEVLNLDIYITDASRNILSGSIGKFLSLDMTREVGFGGFNGAPDNIKLLTDGSADPWQSVLATQEIAWAVFDLGAEYTVDRMMFSCWHDWAFANVSMQVAKTADFSDAVTVYHADVVQNPGFSAMISAEFDPVTGRYVRFTDNAKGEGAQSIISEIQLYTTYGAGPDLIADVDNWTALSGAKFTNDGSVIHESEAYQTDNWSKAYSYNAKKYKNFMIDSTMSIDVTDPGAWGYVGFQVFRQNTEVTQSDVNQGLIVGIEPKGRVLIWNGNKELGALDANVAGWSVGSEFDFRVICYNDIIAVSINGQPVMYEVSSDFDREAGYISIHSGLLPMTVTKLSVTELGDDAAFAVRGEAIAYIKEVKVAVERYTPVEDVLKDLPATVTVTDTAGKTCKIGVEWKSVDYDRSATGTYRFAGTLSETDLAKYNITNAYTLKTSASVFVKPEVDTSVIGNLLSIAAGLNEHEYSAETWEYLQLKVDAAKSILADPFLVQSDINVGMFQLYDAIYGMQFTADISALTQAIEDAKAVDAAMYQTPGYTALSQAIEEAEAFMNAKLKTYACALECEAALKNAMSKLIEKIPVIGVEVKKPVIEPVVEPVPGEAAAEKGCNSSAAGGGAALAVAGVVIATARKRRKNKKD